MKDCSVIDRQSGLLIQSLLVYGWDSLYTRLAYASFTRRQMNAMRGEIEEFSSVASLGYSLSDMPLLTSHHCTTKLFEWHSKLCVP